MCVLSSYCVVCLPIKITTGTCKPKQDLEYRIVGLSCFFDPDAELYTFSGVGPLNGVNSVIFDRFSFENSRQ